MELQHISPVISSVHPGDATGPFPQPLLDAVSLWLASTFCFKLICLWSQIPRPFLPLFKEARFAPLPLRMSPKSEAFPLNVKFSPYIFCWPFPIARSSPHSGTLGPVPSPSEPLVALSSPHLLPAFSTGLCPPCREVTRANPGMYLVLNIWVSETVQ